MPKIILMDKNNKTTKKGLVDNNFESAQLICIFSGVRFVNLYSTNLYDGRHQNHYKHQLLLNNYSILNKSNNKGKTFLWCEPCF